MSPPGAAPPKGEAEGAPETRLAKPPPPPARLAKPPPLFADEANPDPKGRLLAPVAEPAAGGVALNPET